MFGRLTLEALPLYSAIAAGGAAVTVGGSLMGIAGMLVMIPLASVCYSLLRANTHARLRSRGCVVYLRTSVDQQLARTRQWLVAI